MDGIGKEALVEAYQLLILCAEVPQIVIFALFVVTLCLCIPFVGSYSLCLCSEQVPFTGVKRNHAHDLAAASS